MYALGRLTDEEGNDIVDADGDLYVDGYTPRVKPDALDPDTVEEISRTVYAGNNVYAWLVGAAVQEIMVRGADGQCDQDHR